MDVVKRIWRVFYPVLIYYGVSLGIQMAFSVIFSTYIMMKDKSVAEDVLVEKATEMLYQYISVISISTALVVIPVLGLIYYFDVKKKREKYTKVNPLLYIVVAVMGVSGCICFSNLLEIFKIIELFPYYSEVTQELLLSGGFVMSFIATVICAPILEELLFRGLLYRRLEEWTNKKTVAVIISGLCFGVAHGNMVQFIYAFVIAIFMCFVYDRFKTIWAPVIFHMAANCYSSVATEFEYFDFMYNTEKSMYITTAVTFVLIVITTFVIRMCVNRKMISET